MKHAYISARTRPGGTNLGLERIGMKIWWQGYSGLKIINLKNKLWYLKHLGEQPQFIVIHCGGNDLGSKENSLFSLIAKVKGHLAIIAHHFPQSRLVWSQVLPRSVWRFSSNNHAMERMRVRFNRAMAKAILDLEGCYLKYLDMIKNMSLFLAQYGVHHSPLGNTVFLNTLQGGLEYFASGKGSVYPDSY